jgi:NAD(P)-dependent dehydrogenase (short-subunit alcohol dehydrogenase family)
MGQATVWKIAGAVGLGVLAARAVARERRRIPLRGAVAVVTGGGRGLGHAIVQELAREGCRLAICGRDGQVIGRAVTSLRAAGVEAIGYACDASDERDVTDFMGSVLARFGRIDVLINNAGQCFVGPAADLVPDDVEYALRNIFRAQYLPTMAVLPHMRRRGAGRIVNVTSIGGKLPTPHQAAYTAAKFAATGWSETLAIELRKDGIEVSTVTPPPLHNGAPLHAHFNGRAEEEFLWFARTLTSRWTATETRRAARTIVEAARYGDAERAVSPSSWLASRAYGLAPNLSSRMLSKIDRALPPPSRPYERTRMQLGAQVATWSQDARVAALASSSADLDRRFAPG